MAAQTLTDFLVSVRYAVDAASQSQFINAMKQAAGQAGKVSAEIVGLTGAILTLGRVMAETGEKFYFMSQRMGSGIAEIRDTAYAMSHMGQSTEEALGAMEKFGAWTRSMGPAATSYLRSLGVTARDNVGQLRELRQVFRDLGGTLENAQGTDAQRLQYALALKRWQLTGGDEKGLLNLTDKNAEKNEQQAGLIRRMVWGARTASEAQAAEDKWGKTSHTLMEQFRQFGQIFEALRSRFGQALMERLIPIMDTFLKLLTDNIKEITKWLDTAGHGLAFFVDMVSRLIKLFTELPTAVKIAVGILTTLPTAIALSRSPIFMMLAGLTALLLLLDDYKHWQDDQKHPGQITSHFDWSKIDSMFDGIKTSFEGIEKLLGPIWNNYLKPIYDGAQKWAEQLGISKEAFEGIAIAVGLIVARIGFLTIAKAGWRGLLGLLGGGASPAAGAATGAGAGLMTWLLPLATLAYAIFAAGQSEKAEKAEAEKLKEPYARRAALLDKILNDGGTMSAAQRKQLEDLNKEIAVIRRQPALIPIETPEATVAAERKRRIASGDYRSETPAETRRRYGIDPDPDDETKTFRQKVLDFFSKLVSGQEAMLSATGNMFAGPGAPGFAATKELSDEQKQSGRFLAGGFGGGGGGRDYGEDAGVAGDPSALNLTPEQYDAYRRNLGRWESGNRYAAGNTEGYVGKYAFGRKEIAETARQLGEPVPSDAEWRRNGAQQERFLLQYTYMHHRRLMAFRQYREGSPAYRAGMLAASHLGGVGGALNVMGGAMGPGDSNRTRPGDYFNRMQNVIPGGAAGATSAPPLGSGVGGAGGAGQFLRQQHDRNMHQNNSTTIQITPGPNAIDTANRVADAQGRVHERYVRNAEGLLLA